MNFFVDIFLNVNYNFYMKNLIARQQYFGQSEELLKVPIDKRNQEIKISIGGKQWEVSYPTRELKRIN